MSFGQGRVALWRGEGNALDSAGAHHGQLVAGTTFTNGQVGQAFSLRGPSYQGVLVPADAGLNVAAGNGFTIVAWIYPAGSISLYPLLEWGDHGSNFRFSISGPSSDQIPVNCLYAKLGPNTAPYFYTGPNLVKSNEWQQVSFSWDRASGAIRILLNGGVGLETSSASIPGTIGDLHIGYRDSVLAFNGAMDEISLFNRALSQQEVRSLFLADTPPPGLGFRQFVPGRMTLVWPLKFSDFSLQTGLSPTGPWTTTTNQGAYVGSEIWVEQPTTSAQGFFRLIRAPVVP